MAKGEIDWVEARPSLKDPKPGEVTNARIITFPAKYVIGRGVLSGLAEHVSYLGPRKVLIVGSRSALQATEAVILKSLREHRIEAVGGEFKGNSTTGEIDRLRRLARETGADTVIGVGGGRAIDTAKAVAFAHQLPVVVIPTVTATDAPTSRCSIVYNDRGEFETYLVYPKNSDVVIIDSQVVASSPVKYLVAGMGGALGLYLEAKSSWQGGAKNYLGGLPPWSAMGIARDTFENLLQHGKQAKLAVERKAVTPAVEIIIEAITLLGGITFETCSMSVAHSIYHGYRGAMPPPFLDRHLTGTIAAFGAIVHQVIENYPLPEIHRLIEFNRSIGLPTCLADLELAATDTETITRISKIACTTGTARNIWFPIEPKMIFDAMVAADAISRDFLGEGPSS